ncbi:Stc1 domain-containing protein [Cercophora samala]|uniref:Stc1 domain-containing protein n=1 Tax=Cercophora samala TaxID=330535 RepID=A0AA39ZNQ9_9PEZI|nr:Stc1 domain-containing protein [Cercophora samala]
MVATKIRCQNGGEWKGRDKFSQSSLRRFHKKMGNGLATPDRSTISCLEHTISNQRVELQCEGPCDRWRELEFFSKSTRRNQVFWCKDCTEWAEKTEVGEALPAPGEKLFDGEFEMLKTRVDQFMLEDDYDGVPERGASTTAASFSIDDFDDEYEEEFTLLPPGAETTTVTESLAGSEETGAPVEAPVPAAAAPIACMAPAPRAPHWFLGAINNLSAASTPTTLDTLDTLGTPNDPISESSIVAGSQSQTTITAADTSVSAIPSYAGADSFNAWGPEGDFAIATEDSNWKTVTRTAKGPRMATLRPQKQKQKEKVEVRKGGWVKVPGRRTAPSLPTYLLMDTFRGGENFVGDVETDEF